VRVLGVEQARREFAEFFATARSWPSVPLRRRYS